MCQCRRSTVNVAFGSVAVVKNDFNPMAGSGRKADTRPERMSALTDTGRSEAWKEPDLDGS
jgi:hypothetical protein